MSMYVVLLSCTECVVHAFGQSRSPSFPLRKLPHERSLSLSEVTAPSAGRKFATAPSAGRRVAREKEERERERVCVCERVRERLRAWEWVFAATWQELGRL